MRQSSNKKVRENTAFLCPRLSRDDNIDGESYSIGNQKKLLTKVAKEMGYTNLVTFVDDGISGVTMDRPGFNDMMEQLAQGKAAAVFVKDLSRLGRNYIEVGRLMDEFFPEHNIRLVAVSDGIDTAEGENELAPIRNLFKNMSRWGKVLTFLRATPHDDCQHLSFAACVQRVARPGHQQEAAHQQQDQGQRRRTHGAAALRVHQGPGQPEAVDRGRRSRPGGAAHLQHDPGGLRDRADRHAA